MIATSTQRFPTLRLSSNPWWARIYHAFCFLPLAFRVIRERNLFPSFSFHILNAQDRPIAISDGYLRYPAAPGELLRLQPIIVAIEDKRFFRHFGVDFRGVIRAATKNISHLRIVQGGSTITQQLVRNTLLVPERSLLRKVLEVILAIKVEKHYSKHEILDLYCNHVYLGNGIRGFPAAAKIIYRRKLASLNNAQVIGLIGLLRTPTKTYPDGSTQNFVKRQRKISNILTGKSSQYDCEGIKPNPIDIRNHRSPRLTSIVKSELIRTTAYMPTDVRRVGLTLDSLVQTALNDSLREISKSADVIHVAGIVLSTSTANVLGEAAWESGREAQFSTSYFGAVQPGSTFKTFALLSALEQGISADQLLESAPFESSRFKTKNNAVWSVRNYANKYRGMVTLRDALKCSDNTAFARLTEMINVDHLFDLYQSFHLCERGQASPALVLGGHRDGINLLSLASAYMAIARGCVYRRPRIIQYVQFFDGTFQPFPKSPDEVILKDYAVIRATQDALTYAGPALNGITLSGKTGTTSAGSIVAGYNDRIAAAIWVGYGKPMPEGDPKAIRATTALDRFLKKLGYGARLLSI